MLKYYRISIKGCTHYILPGVVDGVLKVHRVGYSNGYLLSKETSYYGKYNSQLEERTFKDRLTNALQVKDGPFDLAAAKSIARHLIKRGVNKVHEFEQGDEGKVSYSPKGIKFNDHKRRRKLSLARYLMRQSGLVLTQEESEQIKDCPKYFKTALKESHVELIQTAFCPVEMKVLKGQDACNIYHLSYGSPFRSCMQYGYNEDENSGKYNDGIFLNNDNVGLLVAFRNGKPIARAKLYTNDDGTYFLDRIYTGGGKYDHHYHKFMEGLTTGDLNCTIFHNRGDLFPYLDHGCVVRLDSETVQIGDDGEDASFANGIDPTYCFQCQDCETYFGGCGTDVDGRDVCDDCLDKYVEIDGEYYDEDDVVYSETYSDHILKKGASYVLIDRHDYDWILDEEVVETYDRRNIYIESSVELYDGDHAAEWDDTCTIEYGEYDGKTALSRDTVNSNRGTVLMEDAFEYDGEWYHNDDGIEEDGMMRPIMWFWASVPILINM